MDGSAGGAVQGLARCEQLMGLGTWVLDLATDELTDGVGIRDLLGLPPEAPAPTLEDYFRAVHPDDQQELADAWRLLRRDGREYCLEHRLPLPGRPLRYMRAAACADVDEDGVVVRAYGMTQDVTQVRTAALAVEQAGARSHAVLASLQDGYLLVQDGAVLEVNRAACELLGRASEQLLGMPVRQVLDVDLYAQDGDLQLRRPDGSVVDVLVTRTLLRDSDDGGSVLLLRDVSSQRAYERLLVSRSEADPLTGLLNSRAFRERLREEVAAAGDSRPLSLALLDLDHFKEVNDVHGHSVGDEVLVAVAQRFRDAVGTTGQLARVGGEEFALLLPATDAAAAHAVLQHVLQMVRATPFPHAGTLTASAGVAQLIDGMSDDALFRLADQYLYEAKARGRDQVR